MRIVTHSLLACLLSGCAFSIAVSDIGKERTRLRPDRMAILPDGSLLIEASLIHRNRLGYQQVESRPHRRYVVVPPHGIEQEITKARSKHGIYARVLPHVNPEDQSSSHVYPAHLRRSHARPGHLPDWIQSEFDSLQWHQQGLDYPTSTGPFPLVILMIRRPEDADDITYFWHYPAQLLLIPALILDGLTFPIQAKLYGHHLN